MAVTREDVEHIAALARLALDEAKVPELVAQLNTILDHMDVLSRIKSDGIIPVAGIGDAAMPLREDVGPPLPLERPPDRFAPDLRDGFFAVPRLATHEDDDEEES